jgi:hypothetical protein
MSRPSSTPALRRPGRSAWWFRRFSRATGPRCGPRGGSADARVARGAARRRRVHPLLCTLRTRGGQEYQGAACRPLTHRPPPLSLRLRPHYSGVHPPALLGAGLHRLHRHPDPGHHRRVPRQVQAGGAGGGLQRGAARRAGARARANGRGAPAVWHSAPRTFSGGLVQPLELPVPRHGCSRLEMRTHATRTARADAAMDPATALAGAPVPAQDGGDPRRRQGAAAEGAHQGRAAAARDPGRGRGRRGGGPGRCPRAGAGGPSPARCLLQLRASVARGFAARARATAGGLGQKRARNLVPLCPATPRSPATRTARRW